MDQPLIIGIDPGKTGAIAYQQLGNPPSVFDCPLSDWRGGGKVTPDPSKMASEVRRVISRGINPICFIEAQGMRRRQSVQSTFHTGEWFGYWLGILASHGVNIKLIEPRIWKEYWGLIKQDKDASRQKALQVFPSLASQLSRKKDHGRAEALLIMAYGRREGFAQHGLPEIF